MKEECAGGARDQRSCIPDIFVTLCAGCTYSKRRRRFVTASDLGRCQQQGCCGRRRRWLLVKKYLPVLSSFDPTSHTAYARARWWTSGGMWFASSPQLLQSSGRTSVCCWHCSQSNIFSHCKLFWQLPIFFFIPLLLNLNYWMLVANI